MELGVKSVENTGLIAIFPPYPTMFYKALFTRVVGLTSRGLV